MSDRVVIRCPGCDRKLGLKPDLLGSHIKCPQCSAVVATREPASKPSSRESSRKKRQPSERKRQQPAQDGRRKSSASARESRKRSTSKAVPDLDPFHDDVEDSLLEEAGGDNNWLDEIYDDDYGNELELPGGKPPKKKKKRKKAAPQAESKTRKRKKKRKSNASPGNPLVWVGSGLVAGLISIVLTIGVAYTGFPFLILIAGIVGAGLIGGAIRSAAGATEGWGPGLLGVAILLPSIFVGRVGAFYVKPELMGFGSWDSSPTTPEQIERYSSEEAMIADVIDDSVAYDHQWLNANGLDEDSLYSEAYWESDEEWLLPFEQQYDPVVWAEGRQRWEKLPESERTERMESTRKEMKRDAGLLSQDEMQQLVAEATSDIKMTERMAEQLRLDEEWLSEAGLTENEVWNFVPPDDAPAGPEAQFHPTVWTAAAERWEAMDESLKSEEKRFVAEDLGITAEDEEETLFIITAVFATLYSMLMPFRYIGCTITAIALAFKTASNLGG